MTPLPADANCRDALAHVERRLAELLADVVRVQRSFDAPPAPEPSLDTAHRPRLAS